MRFSRSTLKLEVNGRPVTLQGEAFLPGYGSPDFVIYRKMTERWEDGGLITPQDWEGILQRVAAEAKEQELQVEVE